MPSRKPKPKIKHAEIVSRFAARLRELRSSRGMTQAELARLARLTPSYLWRLESGVVSPGIDLVDRLATALGTTIHDLLPTASTDPLPLLQGQAKLLLDSLLKTADLPTLLMLCPLLARLAESPTRHR